MDICRTSFGISSSTWLTLIFCHKKIVNIPWPKQSVVNEKPDLKNIRKYERKK